MDYDRSQGYRGPEAFVELPARRDEDDYEEALADHADVDDLQAALVLSASDPRGQGGAAERRDRRRLRRRPAICRARCCDDKRPAAAHPARRRSSACSEAGEKRWQIVQLPEAEAAFIAVDPDDGAIRALVGGFDFHRNKFNHVTQAWRQPGSAFKPFIYSAALEKGFTPATIDPGRADRRRSRGDRQPALGAEELRRQVRRADAPAQALAKSKNMVSIRILRAIDPKYAQDYVTRFGFDADKHPPYLTMALGAGSVTPWQMARAYAVFANGGYLIQPYFIQKIVDDRGNPLGVARPNAPATKRCA